MTEVRHVVAVDGSSCEVGDAELIVAPELIGLHRARDADGIDLIDAQAIAGS